MDVNTVKKVLLIGKNGQVSTYLQKVIDRRHELLVAGRDQIDLAKPAEIVAALEKINPDIVVNPAAYTAVDLAEKERELAFLINRDAVAELAAYCSDHNVPLVHFSTDYVFDGSADRPYTEMDKPNPNGVYGASKLAGEQAVLASGAPAIILRTSWVYSNHGNNFYKTMLRLANDRPELSVVADQIGAPTYAGSIAIACSALVETILDNSEIALEHRGVFHFSCAGETSWCGFAEAIFAANDKDITVNPITTQEYPTPAKRPAYSVLDNQKLNLHFQLKLPSWQVALQACVDETKQSV